MRLRPHTHGDMRTHTRKAGPLGLLARLAGLVLPRTANAGTQQARDLVLAPERARAMTLVHYSYTAVTHDRFWHLGAQNPFQTYFYCFNLHYSNILVILQTCIITSAFSIPNHFKNFIKHLT